MDSYVNLATGVARPMTSISRGLFTIRYFLSLDYFLSFFWGHCWAYWDALGTCHFAAYFCHLWSFGWCPLRAKDKTWNKSSKRQNIVQGTDAKSQHIDCCVHNNPSTIHVLFSHKYRLYSLLHFTDMPLQCMLSGLLAAPHCCLRPLRAASIVALSFWVRKF